MTKKKTPVQKAVSKAKSSAKRQAKKTAQNHPFVVLLCAIFLIIALVVAYFFTPLGPFLARFVMGDIESGNEGGGNSSVQDDIVHYETDELSVHFLELGNGYDGDCVLIDVGETEILIDAGSRQGSAATIVPYIQNYCEDNVIEYCIATHAHQDHIAGFVGTKSATGVFDSFTFGTIIDFPRTNASSSIYKNYLSERDEAVARGAKHFTALECWNQENGARRTYSITDEISFSILYQKYYEQDSSDENNYSVCILLTQGANHYLFTGDLEKAGETSLVESNDLPVCQLYKGGHHGSPTSSNDCLLSVIQPSLVCVCCCAGSDEYTEVPENQFPSQAFIDRVKVYTDQVYVTSMRTGEHAGEFAPLNGNIVVLSDGTELKVKCSNSDVILKDSEWFKQNRIW